MNIREVYFETYGCTANYNSTEIMKGLIRQGGLNLTNNPNFADLIIINSCIVKEPTEEKIRRRIQDLLKTNKKIILAGCMPRVNKEKLQEPNLYLLDTSHVKDIINLIKDIQSNQYEESKYLKPRKEEKLNLPKISKEKLIGITQISEGCLGNCSYCITRLAKGKLFSYDKKEIVDSVESDLQAGCREIWLTSQDCASYGLEQGKSELPSLLKEVLKLKHKFYLRIGMMNSNNVLEILPELIEIYKDTKMFKFLHIPIQSGSDKILKSMNRKYTKKDILKIVKTFRKEFPEMHISTDVILGYPGETEKDFQETYDLIKGIKPETLNFSKFWPRPNTEAIKLKNQISSYIKIQRAKKIAMLHKEICNEMQNDYLNKEIEVLVDQKGFMDFPNTYLARDENYKLYAVQSKEKILGKKVKVKVKKVTPHYLISSLKLEDKLEWPITWHIL